MRKTTPPLERKSEPLLIQLYLPVLPGQGLSQVYLSQDHIREYADKIAAFYGAMPPYPPV